MAGEEVSINVEGGQEMVVMVASKGFCKQVGKIVRRGYLLDSDSATLQEFTDVMVTNVDMLYLSMIFCILG